MRQRIVINVDGPPDEGTKRARISGRKRRRWPRVLAILGLLVLLGVIAVAAGGFLWWRHYQSTPAYAVTCLVDAAQRNDEAEFQKYIDDDEIAKNMVAGVSKKAAARYGYALTSSTQQQIDSILPGLMPRLKQTIHDEAVKQIQAFAAKAEDKPFIFLLITVPSVMTISTEGDSATVKAPVNDRAIELTMRRDADRWKVTELKDDVVVQRVVDSVMKDLPAIGSVDPSSPLLKQATKKNKRRK
jgi:hypothetical protein